MKKYAIAIHGGAVDVTPDDLSAAQQSDFKKGIEQAVSRGYTILEKEGTAVEAVEAAVRSLEDNPLFNAGKGSVFTNEGKIEMDAAVMCGKTLEAGAVAGVTTIKNPVSLAKAILKHSRFVLLAREKAEEFAKQLPDSPEKSAIEFMSADYFFTPHRYEELQKAIEKEKNPEPQRKWGTVGAVALDMAGNIAAATSTGGLVNKKFGRVADTPLIGAGTYANNQYCAISCTGDGEYLIRGVSAYDVACLVNYKNLSPAEACRIVIHDKLTALGGKGGLIFINTSGHIEMAFNSSAMYRGLRTSEGSELIAIF